VATVFWQHFAILAALVLSAPCNGIRLRLDPEEAALGEGEAVLTDALLLRRPNLSRKGGD
jgi:hypothetical protein